MRSKKIKGISMAQKYNVFFPPPSQPKIANFYLSFSKMLRITCHLWRSFTKKVWKRVRTSSDAYIFPRLLLVDQNDSDKHITMTSFLFLYRITKLEERKNIKTICRDTHYLLLSDGLKPLWVWIHLRNLFLFRTMSK